MKKRLKLILLAILGLLPVLAGSPSAQAAPGATITVNSLADDLTVNGDCTLREALRAAALNVVWDGCAAGAAGQPDLIVFAVNGTIHLALGAYIINSPVIIQGNGRDQTIIDAGGDSGIFYFDREDSESGSIGLRALTLQNGRGAFSSDGYNGPFLDLELDDVVIQDNLCVYGGGAITAGDGSVTIRNSLLQRNCRAIDHDGNAGAVTIEDSILRDNFGGAVYGRYVEIVRSLIEDNVSSGSGGGLLAYGGAEIIDSTVRNNIATENGGGLAGYEGPWLIQGSTISGNYAQLGNGGGIYYQGEAEATFTITNSTISSNMAQRGGGLYLSYEYSIWATIRFTTFANNTATAVVGAGGAIFVDPNSLPLTLTRNIIYGNSGTPTCYPTGEPLSGGYNVLQDSSCGNHATDLIGVDPLLGPLANNGGPTQTHALLPDSPAIDHAPCLGGITVDQRGVARPQGQQCDSGAFEFGDLLYQTFLPAVW